MDLMLVVDHEKCTGCRLCEVACSVRHTGVNNPSRSRIHVIKWPNEGLELPMLCMQCERAPCVTACPSSALTHDPSMLRVKWNSQKCIGCKMCVMVCPLGAMGVDSKTQQVIKCDLCDGDPACVRFCDPGALLFVPAHSVDLIKKRAKGLIFSERMRNSLITRART
jgi:Fe-S-cluster-containing hydrogenase component 2